MSYQDNLPWAQMQQLQNAAQYPQQIPGFINAQSQAQMQPNLMAQTTSQPIPQNVYNTLPLQQQPLYGQPNPGQNPHYNQSQTGQPPPPFLNPQTPQPNPQWNTPPPSQYQTFHRPPPPQRQPNNTMRNSHTPQWSNPTENFRSDSSRHPADNPEESSLMDYDFGHMGAAAKNFSSESSKEKESQAMYDASDKMEHDGIQSNQIPDSNPYRQVKIKFSEIDLCCIEHVLTRLVV